MGCVYCKAVGEEFVRAPGLLFIVLSFLINVIAYESMEPSRERDYVLGVWVSSLVCSFIWLSTMFLLPAIVRLHTFKLGLYIFVTFCCLISGLVLGIIGLRLLISDQIKPSERVAVVMLDVAVQWMQGLIELVNFAIHCFIFSYSKNDPTRKSPYAVHPEGGNGSEGQALRREEE